MTADVAVVIIFAPRALRPLNITYYNIQITTSFLAVCWSLRDSFFSFTDGDVRETKNIVAKSQFSSGLHNLEVESGSIFTSDLGIFR